MHGLISWMKAQSQLSIRIKGWRLKKLSAFWCQQCRKANYEKCHLIDCICQSNIVGSGRQNFVFVKKADINSYAEWVSVIHNYANIARGSFEIAFNSLKICSDGGVESS